MATIRLTIPDQYVDRVIHALCARWGKTPENGANAKQALIESIKKTVKRVERREAEEAALALVMTEEEALATVVDPDVDGVVS